MILVAMRQQDKMVHENIDGSGIGRHMQQLMEHYVKLAKRHCKRNCNHSSNWQENLMKYLDCVSIGSIGYDLVDLHNVENEFNQKHTLIYEPTTTPMLERFLISQMPGKWFEIWQLIHPIQFMVF